MHLRRFFNFGLHSPPFTKGPRPIEFELTCEYHSPYCNWDDEDSSGSDYSDSSCCRDDNREYIHHSAASHIKATELLYLSQTLNQEDVIVTNLSSPVPSLGQIKWSTNSPFKTGTVEILFTTLLIRLFLFKNVTQIFTIILQVALFHGLKFM